MTDDAKGQPRLKKFASGALRGIKFGAMAGLAITLVIFAVCVIVMVFNPLVRQKQLAEFTGSPVSTIWKTIAGTALIMLYGALTGAVMMGLMNAFRASAAPSTGRELNPEPRTLKSET